MSVPVSFLPKISASGGLIHNFWNGNEPPSGFDRSVIVIKLPIVGVTTVALDPPHSLWAASTDQQGNRIINLFAGDAFSPSSLTIQDNLGRTPHAIRQLDPRPGGDKQLIVVEENETASFLWWHSKKGGKLDVLPIAKSIAGTRFDRSGKLLAYGTMTGRLGLLSISEGVREDGAFLHFNEVMEEIPVFINGCHDWAFDFSETGEQLFWVCFTRINRKDVQLIGWLDLTKEEIHFMQETFSVSCNEWAHCVSAAHDNSDVVWFGGRSQYGWQFSCGNPKPQLFPIDRQSCFVPWLHVERNDFAIVRRGQQEVLAINPRKSMASHPHVLGSLDARHLAGVDLLHVGVLTSKPEKGKSPRRALCIVVAPKAASSPK